MKKVTYICDNCGAEHDDSPLSLWMNWADAALKFKVNGAPAITALKENGSLNFCDSICLHAYFCNLIMEIEGEQKQDDIIIA